MLRRVYVPYNVMAPHLLNADVLDYQNPPFPLSKPYKVPSWLCSKAIAVSGRSNSIHTGMVDKTGREPVALGMRLGSQDLRLLEDEAIDHPGLIDVWRYTGRLCWKGSCDLHAPPDLNIEIRKSMVECMQRFALRGQYGALNVLRTSAYFVVGLRWFARPSDSDVDSLKRPPFCSQAVFDVFLKHQVRLLNNRTARQVLPGDLVTSPLLTYIGTLAKPDPFANSDLASYYGDSGLRLRAA